MPQAVVQGLYPKPLRRTSPMLSLSLSASYRAERTHLCIGGPCPHCTADGVSSQHLFAASNASKGLCAMNHVKMLAGTLFSIEGWKPGLELLSFPSSVNTLLTPPILPASIFHRGWEERISPGIYTIPVLKNPQWFPVLSA